MKEKNYFSTIGFLIFFEPFEPFITTIRYLHFKGFKPAYSIANLGGLNYLHSYLQSKKGFLKQLLNRYTHTITVNQYKVKTTTFSSFLQNFFKFAYICSQLFLIVTENVKNILPSKVEK